MTQSERRAEILEMLRAADKPVKTQFLIDKYGVSRQIIVNDMRILRTGGERIIATQKGYLCTTPHIFERVVKCRHHEHDIGLECRIVLRHGGIVRNVMVEHRVYGRIEFELNVETLTNVDDLVRTFKAGVSRPLMEITSGYHYHTIRANSEEALDAIEAELKEAGFITQQLL